MFSSIYSYTENACFLSSVGCVVDFYTRQHERSRTEFVRQASCLPDCIYVSHVLITIFLVSLYLLTFLIMYISAFCFCGRSWYLFQISLNHLMNKQSFHFHTCNKNLYNISICRVTNHKNLLVKNWLPHNLNPWDKLFQCVYLKERERERVMMCVRSH